MSVDGPDETGGPIRSLHDLSVARRARIVRHIAWELGLILDAGVRQVALSKIMGIETDVVSKIVNASYGKAFPVGGAEALDRAGYRPDLEGATFASLAHALDAATAREIENSQTRERRALYFLASPMASSPRYRRERDSALRFKELIERYCGVDVFYAGATSLTPAQYESQPRAYEINLEHLEAATRFILLLPRKPKKKPSSVWIEAGIALALEIPSTIIVPDLNWLPYLLKRAHSESVQLEQMSQSEAERLIRQDHDRFFSASSPRLPSRAPRRKTRSPRSK